MCFCTCTKIYLCIYIYIHNSSGETKILQQQKWKRSGRRLTLTSHTPSNCPTALQVFQLPFNSFSSTAVDVNYPHIVEHQLSFFQLPNCPLNSFNCPTTHPFFSATSVAVITSQIFVLYVCMSRVSPVLKNT